MTENTDSHDEADLYDVLESWLRRQHQEELGDETFSVKPSLTNDQIEKLIEINQYALSKKLRSAFMEHVIHKGAEDFIGFFFVVGVVSFLLLIIIVPIFKLNIFLDLSSLFFTAIFFIVVTYIIWNMSKTNSVWSKFSQEKEEIKRINYHNHYILSRLLIKNIKQGQM